MITQTPFGSRFVNRAAAMLAMGTLLVSTFAVGVGAQGMKATSNRGAAKLTQDQRILHALNRLGFGARPGDVERVKAMGVDNYINQQLFPDKIDDSATEARLQNLTTLHMTTAELYEKYPQPGQLLRVLERRNSLPADLAAARDNRAKGGANAASAAKDCRSTAPCAKRGRGSDARRDARARDVENQ